MKKMFVLVVCLAVLVCISISVFSETASAAEKKLKFGFAVMKHDPFMVPLVGGVQEVCDKNGIELIVNYAENDIEKQISNCDDLLQQGIDGLIVMPVDFEGITPALEAAKTAGVPVVSIDAEAAARDLTIAYIASDNYKAGYLCGEHVLKTLKSAKILALTHPEIKCTIDRYQGFKDAIAGHEGYEIIAEQPAKGLMDQGMAVMDNWLQQFKDFDVVFAINDGSCQGAIASMQAANRLKGVQTYAVDGQQQMADYILEGLHTAEAAQKPFLMGQGAAELLIKHLKGEYFVYENLLEVTLLTKDNAADYKGF
jgi:ribose transport system substrate-binding protein